MQNSINLVTLSGGKNDKSSSREKEKKVKSKRNNSNKSPRKESKIAKSNSSKSNSEKSTTKDVTTTIPSPEIMVTVEPFSLTNVTNIVKALAELPESQYSIDNLTKEKQEKYNTLRLIVNQVRELDSYSALYLAIYNTLIATPGIQKVIDKRDFAYDSVINYIVGCNYDTSGSVTLACTPQCAGSMPKPVTSGLPATCSATVIHYRNPNKLTILKNNLTESTTVYIYTSAKSLDQWEGISDGVYHSLKSKNVLNVIVYSVSGDTLESIQGPVNVDDVKRFVVGGHHNYIWWVVGGVLVFIILLVVIIAVLSNRKNNNKEIEVEK